MVDDVFERPENRGDDPEFNSVTTDDLTIGGSDLASSGDFLPIGPTLTPGSAISSSTSSSSYTNVFGHVEYEINLATLFASDLQVAALMTGKGEPNGDQIDIRTQNVDTGSTVAEITGITTDTFFTTSPSTYIAPDSQDTYILQLRNSDNTTTVTAKKIMVQFGIQL